jgi:hypothetical protein
MTAKLTQQNISRLLDRHGIPVREEYPNGYRLPLVQKLGPCSQAIRVFMSRKRDYRRAVEVLTAAGYVFQDYPPHQGYGLVVTGRCIG